MAKHWSDGQEFLLDLVRNTSIAALREGQLEEMFTRALPWMLALAPEDRRICIKELVEAARAEVSTGQTHQVRAALISWRETAVALAVGLSNDEPDWLGEPVAIMRP